MPIPDQLLADWGLTGQRNTAFGTLSGGQKQRLFIALALLGEPEIVVLDELTTGLDPAARRDTWALVQRLQDRGVTVVLVTHAMDEAETLCDRLVVIDPGRIVAEGTPEQMRGDPSHPRGRLPRTSPLLPYRTDRLMTTFTTTPAAPNPLVALATLTRVETLLLLREPAAVAVHPGPAAGPAGAQRLRRQRAQPAASAAPAPSTC